VGCVAGQAGHVVQVQTGFAPPPQSQMTLPNVHTPSPVMHALWLFGALVGQFGFVVPPLLLPLLLPLPPPLLVPLLLPLLPPLLLPLVLLPPLLPLLPPLPPLLLPPSVLASAPSPALVLPPHPGAATTRPPADTETMKRISSAFMEDLPQFVPRLKSSAWKEWPAVSGRSRDPPGVARRTSTQGALRGNFRPRGASDQEAPTAPRAFVVRGHVLGPRDRRERPTHKG
jgi:hypothetical protein